MVVVVGVVSVVVVAQRGGEMGRSRNFDREAGLSSWSAVGLGLTRPLALALALGVSCGVVGSGALVDVPRNC